MWFHDQFHLTAKERQERWEADTRVEEEAGHWRFELQNTLIKPTCANDPYLYWRKKAQCVALPQLLAILGYRYTAEQLYRCYLSRPILVKSVLDKEKWCSEEKEARKYEFLLGRTP